MKRYPGSLVMLAVTAALVAGCSSSDKKTHSSLSCKPSAAECYAAGPDGPGNACLARTDNTGSKYQLRVSQLQVSSPTTLAAPFMQDAIITKKINFAKEPDCFQQGEGNFNILFEFDTTAKTLTVGASVPQPLIGAPKDGTCFAKFSDQASGLSVAPVSAPYTASGDTYTADFDNLVLPIFINPTLTSYALLPLHKISVTATLSSDHDCVGKYNADQLDPNNLCAAEFPWTNGGTFQAYITVAQADTVDIVDMGYSLCVLMSGDLGTWKGTDPKHTCKGSAEYKSTGKLPTGDWCSATNSAGGCADSWHLVTKFAASAIKINDSVFQTCK